jgi:hypothetical protein
MSSRKLISVASFGLTLQFILSLAIFIFVLPGLGLKEPSDFNDVNKAMNAFSASPRTFLLLNLINASFAITSVLFAAGLREIAADYSRTVRIGLIVSAAAAALFVAGGLIPIMNMPSIVTANDISAFRALNGISGGLILAGTFAAGWLIALTGWTGIRLKLFPAALGVLLIASGIVEIFEFCTPLFFVIDPFLGIIWGTWLGIFYLKK